MIRLPEQRRAGLCHAGCRRAPCCRTWAALDAAGRLPITGHGSNQRDMRDTAANILYDRTMVHAGAPVVPVPEVSFAQSNVRKVTCGRRPLLLIMISQFDMLPRQALRFIKAWHSLLW